MHKKHYITVSLLLFAALLLFFSCTQEEIGIFYSLEIESELEEDKGLEDELKVWEMVRTDSSSDDTYFIAAGKVFSRPAVSAEDSTVSWSDVTPPAEGMLCSDIAFFSGTVFALFRTSDGTVSNLYVYRNSANPPWVRVDVDTSVENERIMGIIQVSDTMYVEKFEVDAGTDYYNPYSLWHTTDGSSFNKCSIDNSSNPDLPDDISVRLIFDGDFDGTNYILVSGNAVYRSTDGSSFQEVSLTDTGGTAVTFTDIGGVYYLDSRSLLFLSSESGFIYTNDLATDPDITANWNKSTDLDDSDLVFYDLSYIPTAADGTEVLIVGSDEGYYEIPSLDDLASITPRKPGSDELTTTVNYLNTSLSNGSIRKFFVDSDPDLTNEVIFALTTSNGLWQNRLIADADPHRVWTRE